MDAFCFVTVLLIILQITHGENIARRHVGQLNGDSSNNHGVVHKTVSNNKEIELVTPYNVIPDVTSNRVITSVRAMECDCDYHNGGCSISKTAPLGLACHCKFRTAWTCSGSITVCSNPNSNYCKHPDKSIYSCLLGDGNCEGYKRATCDCDYHNGGCSISRPPPENTACKCIYKGFWSCKGAITGCVDDESPYCKNPDTSLMSCVLGKGDCEGYKVATCGCNFHRGGCFISNPAPANTACRCTRKDFWRCGGEVVNCYDFSSNYCIRPDKSMSSCLQGSGNCGGYEDG